MRKIPKGSVGCQIERSVSVILPLFRPECSGPPLDLVLSQKRLAMRRTALWVNCTMCFRSLMLFGSLVRRPKILKTLDLLRLFGLNTEQ